MIQVDMLDFLETPKKSVHRKSSAKLQLMSFQEAIGPILFIGQCFGFMPVDGILSKDIGNLKFRWKSLRTIYSIIFLICGTVESCMAVRRLLRLGFNIHFAETMIFFVSSMARAYSLFQIARKWKMMMKFWAQCENVFLNPPYEDLKGWCLAQKIRFSAVFLILLLFVEHILAIASGFYLSKECWNVHSAEEAYFKQSFTDFFAAFNYNIYLALFAQAINFLCAFAWNFTDVYLIVMSILLTEKFHCINQKLLNNSKLKSTLFWEEQWCAYKIVCSLVDKVNELNGGTILISFFSNLYFICVQLLNCFNPRPFPINTFYFYYSLFFLIGRTTVLFLMAVSIHDESKKPIKILRNIPTEGWNSEIKRFVEEVSNDTIALSGMKFFFLTRKLVLSVAGTIITYELVLIQFHQDDDISDYDPCRTNPKLRNARMNFKSASRTRSEECIWKIDQNLKENELQTSYTKRKHPLYGKEIVRIITRDGVRDLLVPSVKPNSYPELWQETELTRIKTKAKVQSVEEKMDETKKRLEVNQRLKEESEKRKQKLREIDTAKVSKLDELKDSLLVDETVSVDLLDRAFLARQEQEEEVKRANRLILATKCHVIRDAQIAEKNEIAREFRNEDLRLEKIMSEERDKALIEDEIKREDGRKVLLKYSEDIRKQLRERETIRAKEVERIEEEAIVMKRAVENMNKEEQEKTQIRVEKTKKIRLELQKSSQWSSYFKNLEFEEERIAELKIQEYMRQKLEREKQLALEKQLAKEEKEKEYERIILRQQKLMESKTEKNELEYRRQREQVEREFRKREKEAAIKKREMGIAVSEARAVQLEEVKRQRAIQIQRDEADFKTFVDKLKIEKDREEQRKRLRHVNKYKYRDEIISQMTQKQLNKREMEEKAKRERIAVAKAEIQREQNIKSVIRNKIEDMKRNNIAEKFIKDVERQLHLNLSVK
ncbi:unnamed protein product [Diamesa serratosioi]